MNEAEFLLAIADNLGPRTEIAYATSNGDASADSLAFSRIALAIKLKSRPALSLRAIVEGWDVARIVKELY